MTKSIRETLPQSPLDTTPLLERIHAGMAVVDSAGAKPGSIANVQMGDPQAAGTRGNELPRPSFLGQLGMAVFGDEREPNVREPLRAKLLREGFVKIEGSIGGKSRYAPSSRLIGVSDDIVTLDARAEDLATED